MLTRLVTWRHGHLRHDLFRLGEGMISWWSRNQRNITLSPTEAVYMALSEACSELKWIKMLLENFHLDKGTTTMKEHNQSCISLANEFKLNPRIKNIEVKYHHVKEMVGKKDVILRLKWLLLDRIKFTCIQELMGMKKVSYWKWVLVKSIFNLLVQSSIFEFQFWSFFIEVLFL